MADRLRTERRRLIQLLLRSSIAVSASILVVGLFVWGRAGHTSAVALGPSDLVGDVDLGNRLMLAGVAIVAITPVLRVLALLILWTREKAWRFVATSAIVLVLLTVSLLSGGR